MKAENVENQESPPLSPEQIAKLAKIHVDVSFEILRRKILENFFELPPNSFGVGAFLHTMEGNPHPAQNTRSYAECIQELLVREDFFHFDSESMVVANLNNEELLKSVFLFQKNGLNTKDWCKEISERLLNDQFSNEDGKHGLNCVCFYFEIFRESLDKDSSQILYQFLI